MDLLQNSELVNPLGEAPPCRDESDRKYLHCVTFANVPFLVTRDPDLLGEQARMSGMITITTPEEFLEKLKAKLGDV